MKTSIELTEDFYVHLARGLWLSGYLVKIGKCICKLVSERAKFQEGSRIMKNSACLYNSNQRTPLAYRI